MKSDATATARRPYAKVPCHNIMVLIHEMQLGIYTDRAGWAVYTPTAGSTAIAASSRRSAAL